MKTAGVSDNTKVSAACGSVHCQPGSALDQVTEPVKAIRGALKSGKVAAEIVGASPENQRLIGNLAGHCKHAEDLLDTLGLFLSVWTAGNNRLLPGYSPVEEGVPVDLEGFANAIEQAYPAKERNVTGDGGISMRLSALESDDPAARGRVFVDMTLLMRKFPGVAVSRRIHKDSIILLPASPENLTNNREALGELYVGLVSIFVPVIGRLIEYGGEPGHTYHPEEYARIRQEVADFRDALLARADELGIDVCSSVPDRVRLRSRNLMCDTPETDEQKRVAQVVEGLRHQFPHVKVEQNAWNGSLTLTPIAKFAGDHAGEEADLLKSALKAISDLGAFVPALAPVAKTADLYLGGRKVVDALLRMA